MNRQASPGGKSLSEQAAEMIRQYIGEKEMEKGDKLPNEFQLMELCSVSRSTIREAIKILTFEGLVEVVRGSGTYIAEQKTPVMEADPMGFYEEDTNLPQKALDFFEVRLMLEPEIAAMAAANATYKDCQKLLVLEVQVREEIVAGRSYYEYDIQFHKQIAKCSKNQMAYKLMEIITTGIPVFIQVTKNSLTDQTLYYHKAIAESISSGDAVGARCGMIGHLSHNRKTMLDEVEKQKMKEKSQ